MKVAIRADASLLIGSGHIMRCMVLAEALKGRGASVIFISREHEGNLIHLVEEQGFPVLRLPAPTETIHGNEDDRSRVAWLGCKWQDDAHQTASSLANMGKPDWLIVDHYAIDARWEGMLRGNADRLMVIDDLADRPHDCDILLDQNHVENLEERYEGKLPPVCIRLLGPRYALLRGEFSAARKMARERSGAMHRILVFFGGMDASNETAKAIDVLARFPAGRFETDVIVGSSNPHRAEIEQRCADLQSFRFHCQTRDMARLMAEADLAIGAGGTSTWERCCCGLPSITVSTADNQIDGCLATARHGSQLYLGHRHTVDKESLYQALATLSRTPDLLRHMSERASTLVDARGTDRVMQRLMPWNISLRHAQENDCDNILRWRNAPENRLVSKDPEPISADAHRSWFKRTLQTENRVLLIGEVSGNAVGVLRYDIEREFTLVSVYLVPGNDMPGVGSDLIAAGSAWLEAHRPEAPALRAEILSGNTRSATAFEKAGFTLDHFVYNKEIHP